MFGCKGIAGLASCAASSSSRSLPHLDHLRPAHRLPSRPQRPYSQLLHSTHSTHSTYRMHQRSTTRIAFMPSSSQPDGEQAADTNPKPGQPPAVDTPCPGGFVPVGQEDHWSTLLTTMPGLNCSTWCGRLGEVITHSGPSTDTDRVVGKGAILHLWKATLNNENDESPEGQAGLEPHTSNTHNTINLPASVAINYYTASNVRVTALSQGASGADADRAQSPDGSRLVWDQQLLAAHPMGFVFSPDAPQLSLSLSGWQSQAPALYRVLRLLPLSSSGLAIVNAALPPEFGPALASQQPPGTYWFFEVLLTHPDASGDWQASTLGVAYDWATGQLSSHRYSWQKVAVPVELPPEDLSRVVLSTVTPPARDSSASLSSLLSQLSGQPGLQHSNTTYCYSSDEQQQLMCANEESPTATASVEETLIGDAKPSGTEASSSSGGSGNVKLVTLWFPAGGVYARLPAQLPGAAGSQAEVAFEIGAVHGNGEGLSRCVLAYAGDGDRMLRQVKNDEWKGQQQKAEAS